MNKKEFVFEIKNLGIIPDKEKLEKLDKYYDILVKWNEVMNLTRIIKEEEVYLKHFYDSLTIVKCTDLNKADTLCDVGTGAGFPGIVLKIFFPNLKIVLIDSLNKRVNFLNEVIKQLELKDIIAVHSRMEDYSKFNAKQFDIITSRAVAKIPKLVEISINSLKDEGSIILYKANCEEEINDSKDYLNRANCFLKNIVEFELPIEKSRRTLIDIKKKKSL